MAEKPHVIVSRETWQWLGWELLNQVYLMPMMDKIRETMKRHGN